MYQLASCCLLFIGFLNPLVSLPVTDSRDMSLQLPAPEDDARLALEELERASILKLLPEVLGAGRSDGLLGAERGDGLREADPTMNISNPRSHPRKFQAFPEEDPNIFLSQLLARPRKQHKQHGPPLECFWKYCV
ncbi:urotensin-2 [Marmota marmota marmota]|uniref:urotensin-2 n=1 Tax=Marmota marmota marmota TaxID=9994 RepID=UPI000762A848|nr:urotensin-2 [Marmota marmota marmota]